MLLSCYAGRCAKKTLPVAMDLRALASAGHEVLAAGRHGLLMERRQGRWRRLDLGPAAAGKDLLALWHGAHGTYVAGDKGLLMRREEQRWVPLTSNTQAAITSLWGNEEQLYAAAGDALLRCSAKACEKLTTLPVGTISNFWGIPSKEGRAFLVLSHEGALHRFTQGRWSRERVGFAGRLLALWGRQGHVWAVGEKGAILHRLPR
ncbi:MAG: hypothetical protein JRH20_04060 [Deltaproteobacteria bacterium]|nr:hypothetical protein [Deltaproteobacteria bacterium]